MMTPHKHTLILSSLQSSIDHLVSRVRQRKQTDPFAEVNILLPSAHAIQDLHARLGDLLAVHLHQFYSLAQAIVVEAALPIKIISDSTIRLLIQKILTDMHAGKLLSDFAPMLNKPGFVEVILEWLREMKSQGIHPDDYQAFASSHPNLRDAQLSELYTRYQNYLNDKNYADPDGRLWVAAEALEQDPTLFLHQSPLYILGHDQFTPVQLRILKALADRFSALEVHLSWDSTREAQSLPLSQQRETRDLLLSALPLQQLFLPQQNLSDPSLTHLQHQVFAPEPKTAPTPSTLQLVEAPSRETEVRSALRSIKKLLLAGTAPSAIAILAPHPSTYQSFMRTVSAEYAVPISSEISLAHEPLVLDLINLLQLAPDFTWRSTFLALRSAYVQQPWLSPDQVDLLDRLTREQPVLEGREQWLSALKPLQEAFPDVEDLDLGHPPLISELSPEQLQGLREGLAAFFDHLTPPPEATIQAYTWWFQTRLLGIFPAQDNPDQIMETDSPSLDMFACCRSSPQADHDLLVLEKVLASLQDLFYTTLRIQGDASLPWQEFCQNLLKSLHSQTISPDPLQTAVLFAPLAEGRARIFEHVFILGLSEGEFPSKPQPDVFYAPEEREKFPLPIRRYTPAHDVSLFWQGLNNVTSQLTLLRPYIDENGSQWQPSPFWDAVRACFEKVPLQRIPIADVIALSEAASTSELLLALVQTNAEVVPAELKPAHAYAQAAERIHASRNSYRPPGCFEGIFQSQPLKETIAERHASPGQAWSASRLNTYGNCPFNFFAKNLLKLEARPEPEEGLNAMQRGSLLHTLLEKTLAQVQHQGIPLDADHSQEVLQALDASCRAVFPSAHLRYNFQPTPLWHYEQRELQHMLQEYLRWECEQSQGKHQPYLQEAQFGTQQAAKGVFRVEGELSSFLLRGVIDRIDRDEAGNLQVIDYKSGSSTYAVSDIEKGLALQTALYALVAQSHWAAQQEHVVRSEYRHLPTRKSSGALKFESEVEQNKTVQQAVACALQNIDNIRLGIFPSATEKNIRGEHSCTSYCDFAPLCRVSRQSISKARKAGYK